MVKSITIQKVKYFENGQERNKLPVLQPALSIVKTIRDQLIEN